eukprot:gb/GECG01009672.1/.p1 GENE.gb/GECG01009672.1/~~gb/GECG01009672.1/.p1  ORF type:complete len:332 (+),score=18.12 gb/GECG01009672.1/:1-996(+)
MVLRGTLLPLPVVYGGSMTTRELLEMTEAHSSSSDAITGLTWTLTIIYFLGSAATALQFYNIDRHFSSWVRQKKIFALLGASLLVRTFALGVAASSRDVAIAVAGNQSSPAVFVLDYFASILMIFGLFAQLMQWSTAFQILSEDYEKERKRLRKFVATLVLLFILEMLIEIIAYGAARHRPSLQERIEFGGNVVYSILLLLLGGAIGYSVLAALAVVGNTAISPHIRTQQRQRMVYYGTSISVTMVIRSLLLLTLAGEYFHGSRTELNSAEKYGSFLLCYYLLLDLYPIVVLLFHNRHIPVMMMSVQPQFKFESTPLQVDGESTSYGTLNY